MEKSSVWTKSRHWHLWLLIVSLVVQSILPTKAQAPPSKTVQLYLKQTEAKDAFNLLSKASGQNLVLNNQLNGQVSLRLQNVSFEEALNALCLSLGATYVKTGGVYVIAQPNSEKSMPFLSSNPEAENSDTDPGMRMVMINVKNGNVDGVLQELANQAGVEIIIMGDIKGAVTIRLQSMPFEDALKTILSGSKLSYYPGV